MTWVPPEEFFGPDINPERVFAAVGRALCAWETMEQGFATLYTIFRGRSRTGNRWVRNSDKLVEYGMTGRLASRGFEGRMEMICKGAERYFALFPSQEREAILDTLIAAAKPLSQKRHQIAHCVVGPDFRTDDKTWPGLRIGPTHFAIMPPFYAAMSLTKRDKPTGPPGTPFWMYSYRIKDIDGFADDFRALGERIEKLINDIDPPEKS